MFRTFKLSNNYLAKYIKYLDNNDTAYDAFFEWKKHYRLEKPGLMFGCALCEVVHSTKRNTEKSMAVLTNNATKKSMVGLRLLRTTTEALLFAKKLH